MFGRDVTCDWSIIGNSDRKETKNINFRLRGFQGIDN